MLRTRTAHGESRESGATSVVNRAESAGGWYFHLVIGEMAEPAKWSSRRAHWFFPRTSRPLCATVWWARSLTCNRRRARRAGPEERLPPRRQAGIDPIKVARRLWKATRGMARRPSQRPVLPRSHGAAASSDPKNKEISAAATSQEETRLPDLAGPERPDLEDRDDVET